MFFLDRKLKMHSPGLSLCDFQLMKSVRNAFVAFASEKMDGETGKLEMRQSNMVMPF